MKKLLAFAVFISLLSFSNKAEAAYSCSFSETTKTFVQVQSGFSSGWKFRISCLTGMAVGEPFYAFVCPSGHLPGSSYCASSSYVSNMQNSPTSSNSDFRMNFSFVYSGDVLAGEYVFYLNVLMKTSLSQWEIYQMSGGYAGNITPVTTTTTSTTSTVAPTTTTVSSNDYYCLKPGGIGINLIWKHSTTINFANPIYYTTPFPGVLLMTLNTWNSKSDIEKNTYNMNEVAVKPIPTGGCSSLNQTLVLPTTTTTTTTTTVPPTTTTTVPPTTTTTIYNPRITYCQATITNYVNSVPQWNYANWQQGNELLSTYNSNALVYPNSYRYPVPVAGCSSLNTTPTTTTTTTTTTVAPVVQQQAPTQFAQPAKPLTPVAPAMPVQLPAVQAPTATLPKVQFPVVQTPAIPAKSQWKYVTKKVIQTVYSNVRTGAVCRDGSMSNATGRGACSWHGGVAKWLTLPPKKVYVNKKYKCYLNNKTNQYTSNCVAV